MSATLVEIVEPPKTQTAPVRNPAPRLRTLTARGFQQENSIDLWVCSYNGVTQLSAFVYPTKLLIQYRMPEIDSLFSDFSKRVAYRDFTEIAVEELNEKFRKEAGTAIAISHPVELECYLKDGNKIYEHSFDQRAADYVSQIIREMR